MVVVEVEEVFVDELLESVDWESVELEDEPNEPSVDVPVEASVEELPCGVALALVTSSSEATWSSLSAVTTSTSSLLSAEAWARTTMV